MTRRTKLRRPRTTTTRPQRIRDGVRRAGLRRRVAELTMRLESCELTLEALGAALWTVIEPYVEAHIRYAVERAVDDQILKIDERVTDARIDARRSAPPARHRTPRRGDRRR